jgi:hypothetical protein
MKRCEHISKVTKAQCDQLTWHDETRCAYHAKVAAGLIPEDKRSLSVERTTR